VTDRSVFQDQIRQLGKLITQFDQMPEGPQKVACKELVQLLMDVHGAGLERVMEIVFEDPASGRAIVDKLARDSVVSSLLVLYSLHPDDLETRVRKAVDQMLPRLRKLSCIFSVRFPLSICIDALTCAASTSIAMPTATSASAATSPSAIISAPARRWPRPISR